MAFIAAALMLAGPVIGAVGATSAAQTQADAANHSADLQMQMFQQISGNEKPFVQGGQQTLAELLKGLGIGPGGGGMGTGPLNRPFTAADYKQSPGYQFEMDQGLDAILNKQSALGGVGGGNSLKALMGYGEGLASQDYWKAYDAFTQNQDRQFKQLGDITQLGEAAGSNQTTGASTFGGNIGSDIIGAGNATSAGQVGATNSLTGLLANPQLATLLQGLVNGGGSGAAYGSALASSGNYYGGSYGGGEVPF